jgi:hypothetical protein
MKMLSPSTSNGVAQFQDPIALRRQKEALCLQVGGTEDLRPFANLPRMR